MQGCKRLILMKNRICLLKAKDKLWRSLADQNGAGLLRDRCETSDLCELHNDAELWLEWGRGLRRQQVGLKLALTEAQPHRSATNLWEEEQGVCCQNILLWFLIWGYSGNLWPLCLRFQYQNTGFLDTETRISWQPELNELCLCVVTTCIFSLTGVACVSTSLSRGCVWRCGTWPRLLLISRLIKPE